MGLTIASLCSSMYLHDFDNWITKKEIPYIRYADDFLIFGSSYDKVAVLKEEVRNLLKSMDLDIEKPNGFHKTEIFGFKKEFSYLGFEVIYS